MNKVPKVYYVRVVRSDPSDSIWCRPMNHFVNDGRVYTTRRKGGVDAYLQEADYYFPTSCLHYLTAPEVIAHLHRGFRVKK